MEDFNTKRDLDVRAKMTVPGCILTLLSTAVIFGLAIPIVHWRDPDTGEPLPRIMAIVAPLLVGAAFHGLGTLLLRLVGLHVYVPPKKNEDRSPDEDAKYEK
jgi:hypothetical protein